MSSQMGQTGTNYYAASHAPAGIASPRHVWRPLIWIAPVTALWIALTYSVPAISANSTATTAVRLMTYAFIAVGLWLGLEATDLRPDERRATWLTVMIVYTLWMAIAWSSAIDGVFRTNTRVPTLPIAIFLPVILGAPLVLTSKRIGQLLDAMPTSWLVALQVYRVFGSWALVAALHGTLPLIFGVPAGIGDTLTGLLAFPAAMAVATGTTQARGAIAWNILGLADLVIAVTLGVITSPGPTQLIVTHAPSIGAGIYPGVLTPAFVVPGAVLLHMLSLRQLRRRSRAEAARRVA